MNVYINTWFKPRSNLKYLQSVVEENNNLKSVLRAFKKKKRGAIIYYPFVGFRKLCYTKKLLSKLYYTKIMKAVLHKIIILFQVIDDDFVNKSNTCNL